MGPFVDETTTATDPLAIFHQVFNTHLTRIVREMSHIRIILVPSTRDGFHPWCILPQPPFDHKSLFKHTAASGISQLQVKSSEQNSKLYERIHCVPNPCILAINEVLVGLCTTDILLHLSSEEVYKYDICNAVWEPVSSN
jgi:DNA polymerase alpha subunit B